jgi:hypothetical protein
MRFFSCAQSPSGYTFGCKRNWGIPVKELIEKILGYLPQYFTDFGAVFCGPKSFIAQRHIEADSAFADCLLFLGISLALVAVMITPALPVGTDIWKQALSLAIVCLVSVPLYASAIRIAWWLVGGRAPIRSFIIVYSYFFGVIVVILTGFQLVEIGFFKLLDPDLYGKMIIAQSNRQALPDEAIGSTVFWIAMSILGLGVSLGSVWGFVAWGSYRNLNGLSKGRSFVAMMIAGVFCPPILPVVLFLTAALSLPVKPA